MAERDRYQAGVMPFAQRAYGNPDDQSLDSDVLVDAIETAAAVAGESSTATGRVVWTDRLTACARYRATAYRAEGVSGAADQYLKCISYNIDLFEDVRTVDHPGPTPLEGEKLRVSRVFA